MNWLLILSGANNGKFNMDFDLQLTKSNPRLPVLRFYRWQPYCISLGANQSFSDVNLQKASNDGIDVVKRPTGGRAILHSEELTYSVIYPIGKNLSSKNLYRDINLAIKNGLINYDPKLNEIELENNQINFRKFYKEDKSSICFAVSSRNELNYSAKKLVGSAQRKIGNVILQHGSILCGDYHLKIIDYLNLNNDNVSQVRKDMIETTDDLQNILNNKVDYKNLIQSIISGFESHFMAKFDLVTESQVSSSAMSSVLS